MLVAERSAPSVCPSARPPACLPHPSWNELEGMGMHACDAMRCTCPRNPKLPVYKLLQQHPLIIVGVVSGPHTQLCFCTDCDHCFALAVSEQLTKNARTVEVKRAGHAVAWDGAVSHSGSLQRYREPNRDRKCGMTSSGLKPSISATMGAVSTLTLPAAKKTACNQKPRRGHRLGTAMLLPEQH